MNIPSGMVLKKSKPCLFWAAVLLYFVAGTKGKEANKCSTSRNLEKVMKIPASAGFIDHAENLHTLLVLSSHLRYHLLQPFVSVCPDKLFTERWLCMIKPEVVESTFIRRQYEDGKFGRWGIYHSTALGFPHSLWKAIVIRTF